jgi:hypothetical protein
MSMEEETSEMVERARERENNTLKSEEDVRCGIRRPASAGQCSRQSVYTSFLLLLLL